MKDLVLKEITKELTWKERILLMIFKRYSYKILKIGITYGFNNK